MCQSSAWFRTMVTTIASSVHSCSATPLPIDPPVGSAATSGFDVIPGEASKCLPTAINFLAQSWLPGHPVSSLVDHQCMTVCPLDFSLIKETITVMFSNKNAHKHIDTALCRHLTCFTPKKSQVYVAVLRGPRMGQVCKIDKVYRA